MRIIRGGHLPTAPLTATALAIGNFDGVHQGHQALLAKLVAEAKARQLTPVVFTFEPPPQVFFASDSQLLAPRLTPLRQKIALFADHGIDTVYLQRFDEHFSHLSKQAFITDKLVAQLGTQLIIVGEDFRFGYQRQGSFSDLTTMATTCGFKVLAAPQIVLDKQRISSTWIREALQAGDLTTVERLLGRPYCLCGRVAHGKKLGRQLGFPTANLYFHGIRRLAVRGIYAVRVTGIANQPLAGVSYVSEQLPQQQNVLEVFLLDFNEEIYGRQITVEFIHKLRDDCHFDEVERLKVAISQDIAAARHFFQPTAVGLSDRMAYNAKDYS
ncbi:MAG: bifunctional riboflavin kinase/FAD synthetase [Gammaproteobacteria bacterium]|nr:bifunctional riboflavin kinase/FAD synthetase [Gammaproteobacteria bacterium]